MFHNAYGHGYVWRLSCQRHEYKAKQSTFSQNKRELFSALKSCPDLDYSLINQDNWLLLIVISQWVE